MSGGRPSKYDPAFCERVIELGRGGASKAEMCLELDIHHTTLEAWQQRHPEFSEAVKRALWFAQGWWEREGRVNTFGSDKFHATSYIFQMKNRFRDDWNDRTITEHAGKVQTEEIGQGAAKIAALLDAIDSRTTGEAAD